MGMFSGLSIRFFSWPIRTWIKKIPNLRDWYFMTKYWLFWHERLNIIFLFSDKFFGSEKFFELKLSLKSALHIAETAFFKEKFKCLNNSLKALLYKFDIKATLITTGIGCFKSFGLSSMVQYQNAKGLSVPPTFLVLAKSEYKFCEKSLLSRFLTLIVLLFFFLTLFPWDFYLRMVPEQIYS